MAQPETTQTVDQAIVGHINGRFQREPTYVDALARSWARFVVVTFEEISQVQVHMLAGRVHVQVKKAWCAVGVPPV